MPKALLTKNRTFVFQLAGGEIFSSRIAQLYKILRYVQFSFDIRHQHTVSKMMSLSGFLCLALGIGAVGKHTSPIVCLAIEICTSFLRNLSAIATITCNHTDVLNERKILFTLLSTVAFFSYVDICHDRPIH